MQFSDASSEIELRLQLGETDIEYTSKHVLVDADYSSLTVSLNLSDSDSPRTLIQTNQLFHNIKPSETIWFVNLF